MNKRFEAIDIARGLTLAGMILVNNPGSWEYVYAPLLHAEFNGLTPTDLVFPFFVFIMGYSIYLSFRNKKTQGFADLLPKILRRSCLIFLFGIALNWLSQAAFSHVYGFESLRIPGVLQRLAVCYFFVSILAVLVKDIRKLAIGTATLLLLYVLLLAYGNGYELTADNIALKVDVAVFSASHIYTEGGVLFEPEGLVSTIPAVCHTMLGYICARLAHSVSETSARNKRLLLFAVVVGLLFVFVYLLGVPLNKKMWSTSFVLCTSALCAMTILLADFAMQSVYCKPITNFFSVFGKNCIAIYVISDLLAILGGITGVSYWIYETYTHVASTYTASLLYAITFILINWLIAFVLYKKRIMIRL